MLCFLFLPVDVIFKLNFTLKVNFSRLLPSTASLAHLLSFVARAEKCRRSKSRSANKNTRLPTSPEEKDEDDLDRFEMCFESRSNRPEAFVGTIHCARSPTFAEQTPKEGQFGTGGRVDTVPPSSAPFFFVIISIELVCDCQIACFEW